MPESCNSRFTPIGNPSHTNEWHETSFPTDKKLRFFQPRKHAQKG